MAATFPGADRQALDLLKAVLDTSTDAVIARDLTGRILLWSAGAERIYGYTADEMIGQSIAMLIPPEERAEFDQSLASILAGAKVETHDVVRVTKSGERVDIALTVSPITNADGRVVAACVIGRDITARRRAERGRRASEARWRAIVDSAVDGIVVIDGAGRIESFNPAAERLFGYSLEEVAGGNVSILMPEPAASEHDAYIRRYQTTHEPRIIGIGREVTARRKDGSLFPAHLSVAEVSIEGEQRFTGIIRDLTDRVKLEARLREEAGLARIGELAAVLAHEVKNPLAAVSGAVQVLADKLPSPEDHEIIDEVLRRLDALGAMMGDLLLYARPPKPRLAPVQLADLLESLVAFMRLDEAWQGVTVQVDGEAPPVMADGELLKVALQNLFVNAVQAMDGRGRLVIRLQHAPGFVHIDVSDTGPGISEAAQTRLFTPFYTTKARGTGLGLPTVRRIAEAHRGTIEVLATGPAGSTLRFTLPVPSDDAG
jgi:two-component system sensor kinase FixL